MYDVAVEYENSGLWPVPFDVSKTDCTCRGSWKSKPKKTDGWKANFLDCNGIGIITGKESGNLCCIDVDAKHDSTKEINKKALEALKYVCQDYYDDFYIEKTRSDGIHILYRLKDEVGPKYVPANVIEDVDGIPKRFALIEVLGEGQLVFTYPSAGYEVLQGDILDLPLVDRETHEELMKVLRTFTQVPHESGIVEQREWNGLDGEKKRPGDIYNERVEHEVVIKMLTDNGWKVHQKIGEFWQLTRPGKDAGISATYNHDGRKCLYSFSVNVEEFQSRKIDDTLIGHTPFAILTAYHFGGDFCKAAATLAERGYTDDDWDEFDIDEGNIYGPKMDLDVMLPAGCERFKEYINALAESYHVAPEMVLMPALSTLSMCLAGAIKIKPGPEWIEEPMIWTLTRAESGEKKTPVLNNLTKPVVKWIAEKNENRAGKEHKEKIKKKMLNKMADKLEKESMKHDYNSQEFEDLIEEATQLKEKSDRLKDKIKLDHIIQSDITPEGVVQHLSKKGTTIGIISSEAEAIDIALGLYSDKTNVSIYLKGYAGESYVNKRKETETIYIENARVTMGLLAQSEPIANLMGDKAADNRGMNARFLFCCPISEIGFRSVEMKIIPENLKDYWENLIYGAMNLPHVDRVEYCDATDAVTVNDSMITLKMDDEAAAIFKKMRIENEKSFRKGGDLSNKIAWGAKLMGNIARVAATLQMIADGEKAPSFITGEVMQTVERWVPWLIAHREAIVHNAVENVSLDAARTLVEKFGKSAKLSDAVEYLRRNIKPKKSYSEWKKVIDEGVSHGFLRITKSNSAKNGGRPSTILEIHPGLV